MPVTFDKSKGQIATLAKQFRTNFSLYHTADYKEAHARNEKGGSDELAPAFKQ